MLFTGYSRRTLLAFFLALFVHLMLLAILMVSLDWSSKSQPTKQDTIPVVQATVVDEDKLLAEAEQQQQVRQEAVEAEPDLAEIERQQQAAAEQARQEAERQRELQQQEQERLKQLEAARQAKEEARRKAEAEKKRIEEEKRRAEAERRRLEEEKERRKAEAEKRRAEEEKRWAEAEKQRLEEERRRVEAAAKRKAEEERRQQELQARLETEQNAAQIASALERFKSQVRPRVKRYWTRPPGTRDDMAAMLRVEMLPSGEVRNVEVIQSSGDRAFDRSAQAAVYKAAPLPAPADPAAAAQLRSFQFEFTAGN